MPKYTPSEYDVWEDVSRELQQRDHPLLDFICNLLARGRLQLHYLASGKTALKRSEVRKFVPGWRGLSGQASDCSKKPRAARGPAPKTRDRVVKEMMDGIEKVRLTIDGLRNEKQDVLAETYQCSRDVAVKARKIVLSQLETTTNSNTK
jgi:hypothetical protein